VQLPLTPLPPFPAGTHAKSRELMWMLAQALEVARTEQELEPLYTYAGWLPQAQGAWIFQATSVLMANRINAYAMMQLQQMGVQ